MSIWTSKARRIPGALAKLVPLCLAACVAGEGPPDGSLPASVAFLGGAVTAAAPPGYCIDRRASHQERDSAVVLMGRCSERSSAPPVLVTVSIGAEGSASVLRNGAGALSDYFRSAPGRAALARDGRAESVRLRQVELSDDVLMLSIYDRNLGDYRRAILGLRGRLVTISVTAPGDGGGGGGGSLPEAGTRTIMEHSIRAMRQVNPERSG
ncbi:hypothetical protein [Pseudogemmobacter sonorensis]|uniref:hypothetical protein n=1 Tax=Pseudogemmobacter sonorensis TaxID=2989681 RepID=UPI0036BFEF61